MPRGSRPGERRGGRRRGTPNKKTAFKNSLFLAAAAHSDSSPLHFMLALMRDPSIPLDLRIEMAIAAAPLVHARPRAVRRLRTNPMDFSPLKGSPDISAPRVEQELSALEPSAGSDDEPTPLNFLLSIMKDPDATPKHRIKAAKVAARYKHAVVVPDKPACMDEYGFMISPELAKAIFADWRRLSELEDCGSLRSGSANDVTEAAEIRARQESRFSFLQCPPDYTPKRDIQQWIELKDGMRRNRLSKAEETQLAHAIARMTAHDTSIYRTPSGRAWRRIEELEARSMIRKRTKGISHPKDQTFDEMVLNAKSLELTPGEKSELQQLRENFPPLRKRGVLDDLRLVELIREYGLQGAYEESLIRVLSKWADRDQADEGPDGDKPRDPGPAQRHRASTPSSQP